MVPPHAPVHGGLTQTEQQANVIERQREEILPIRRGEPGRTSTSLVRGPHEAATFGIQPDQPKRNQNTGSGTRHLSQAEGQQRRLAAEVAVIACDHVFEIVLIAPPREESGAALVGPGFVAEVLGGTARLYQCFCGQVLTLHEVEVHTAETSVRHFREPRAVNQDREEIPFFVDDPLPDTTRPEASEPTLLEGAVERIVELQDRTRVLRILPDPAKSTDRIERTNPL